MNGTFVTEILILLPNSTRVIIDPMLGGTGTNVLREEGYDGSRRGWCNVVQDFDHFHRTDFGIFRLGHEFDRNGCPSGGHPSRNGNDQGGGVSDFVVDIK